MFFSAFLVIFIFLCSEASIVVQYRTAAAEAQISACPVTISTSYCSSAVPVEADIRTYFNGANMDYCNITVTAGACSVSPRVRSANILQSYFAYTVFVYTSDASSSAMVNAFRSNSVSTVILMNDIAILVTGSTSAVPADSTAPVTVPVPALTYPYSWLSQGFTSTCFTPCNATALNKLAHDVEVSCIPCTSRDGARQGSGQLYLVSGLCNTSTTQANAWSCTRNLLNDLACSYENAYNGASMSDAYGYWWMRAPNIGGTTASTAVIQSPRCYTGSKKGLLGLLGLLALIPIVLFILILLCICWKKKRGKDASAQYAADNELDPPPVIDAPQEPVYATPQVVQYTETTFQPVSPPPTSPTPGEWVPAPELIPADGGAV